MKDEKDLIRAFVCAAGGGHMRYHWPHGLGSSTCQSVTELFEVRQSQRDEDCPDVFQKHTSQRMAVTKPIGVQTHVMSI